MNTFPVETPMNRDLKSVLEYAKNMSAEETVDVFLKIGQLKPEDAGKMLANLKAREAKLKNGHSPGKAKVKAKVKK